MIILYFMTIPTKETFLLSIVALYYKIKVFRTLNLRLHTFPRFFCHYSNILNEDSLKLDQNTFKYEQYYFITLDSFIKIS